MTNNNKTNDEVQEEVEQLLEEMTIDAKATASNQRKLVSAGDERASARLVGTIGTAFFVTVCLVVVMSDIPRVWRAVRGFHKHCKACRKHGHG